MLANRSSNQLYIQIHSIANCHLNVASDEALPLNSRSPDLKICSSIHLQKQTRAAPHVLHKACTLHHKRHA